MDRRKFLGTTAAAGAALIAKPYIARAAKHELLVAEPVHSTGYLPMYIAMAKDYFAEADIEVKIVTIETGGGHTNAVLSGQAFAFIGGPEHNAFAKAKGAELRAVVHCVDRGNVYICAAKGHEPKDSDWPAYFKGKSDRARPLRRHAELDHPLSAREVEARRQDRRHADRDAEFGRARRRQGGQAKIGVVTEPMITQGIKQGSGASRSSTCRRSSAPTPIPPSTSGTNSIKKEPEVVRGFVRGMMKGLKFLYADKDGAADIAKKQFPTMAARGSQGHARPLVRATRCGARTAWSAERPGKPARPWCMGAGMLKTDVNYDDIIDMSFVESVRASL